MIKSLFLPIMTVVLLACGQEKNDETPGPYEMMIGSFSSEEQSINDSNYYHISLHMAPVWTESGKNWLYVEQALGTMQERPYRQRFYLVEEISEGEFKSSVYSLKNDSLVIGKWKDPSFFDQFDESILDIREGCAVFLSKNESGFSGSTKDQDCTSSLRGASYASSEVSITKGQVTSWDRGFDSSGAQVWGAELGPYIFKRINP